MMYKGSLFERLTGAAADYSQQPAGEALKASLAAHLNRFLNTHINATGAMADYGMPDLNDLRFSTYDAIDRVKKHLEAAVPKYDPRLSNVSVVQVKSKDLFTVNLVIEGDVHVGGEVQRMQFNTQMGDGTNIVVS